MKNKERKELILADLKEEKKKIKECNYEKPNKKNLAYEEEYKKVDEALGKSTLIGSGEILFSSNPNHLADVLSTTPKVAKTLILTKIPDKSKKSYTNKEGNEETGISKEVLHHSDEKIKLPMQGKTQSLNVSVACGAVLYEAVRQRLS